MVISLFLFFCDYRYKCFSVVRNQLSLVVVAVQYAVNRPLDLIQDLAVDFTNKQKVLKDNAILRSKVLLLNLELQRLSFLEDENSRLRLLLNYSKRAKGKILPAELLTSVTSDFSQLVTIDKGEADRVYVGQLVLDTHGLFGQVVTVWPQISMVMPITNNNSAIPVMIVRNNLQTIAIGTGDSDYLELVHLPETADIKVGDNVVTSGLGRIFPAGYQIGVIKEIKWVVGERFMKILVSPKAHINGSRHVFLINQEAIPKHLEQMSKRNI